MRFSATDYLIVSNYQIGTQLGSSSSLFHTCYDVMSGTHPEQSAEDYCSRGCRKQDRLLEELTRQLESHLMNSRRAPLRREVLDRFDIISARSTWEPTGLKQPVQSPAGEELWRRRWSVRVLISSSTFRALQMLGDSPQALPVRT